jgi:hypothetical protein
VAGRLFGEGRCRMKSLEVRTDQQSLIIGYDTRADLNCKKPDCFHPA